MIGVVIQARMGSSRLPGKVLMNLPYGTNHTVLEHVVSRVNKSKRVNEVIVATTTSESDKELIDYLETNGYKYFCGSEDDVLSRYYKTAKEFNLDIIVRITSDCPLIDPNLIDKFVIEIEKGQFDYVSNTMERTYPRGFDVEVFTFASLEEAYYKAEKEADREHVTPYLINNDNLTKKSMIANYKTPRHDIRITLDTEEDYALICAIYDYLWKDGAFITAKQVLDLFDQKPWLKKINSHIEQKKIELTVREDLEQGIKHLKLQNNNISAKILKEILENNHELLKKYEIQ